MDTFRALSWPHLRRCLPRALLTVASIALAVALFVSMRVSEHSLVASYRRSTEILAGAADVTVTHGRGVGRDTLERIAALPGVRATPVVQETVMAPRLGTRMLVLGVDFSRDTGLRDRLVGVTGRRRLEILRPRRLILGLSFARRHGLDAGDHLELQTSAGLQDFTIVGLLDDREGLGELALPVAAMFVHRAQSAFGRGDRYDRIDVALHGTSVERLQAVLGADHLVEPAQKTPPALAYQLQQFRILLHVVTWLALATALFLTANSLHLSVVERRHDLGVLLAVGASRAQIVGLILGEALALGLVGTAAGLALGIGGAAWLLDAAGRFANLLVHVVNVRQLRIPADVFPWAVAIGCGAAALGAGFPAWLAARLEPLEALARNAAPDAAAACPRGPSRLGVACVAAAILLGCAAGSSATCGVAALLLGCCGTALVVPRLLAGVGGRLRPRAADRWSVTRHLALDAVAGAPARAGLTVVAFASSLALVIAVAGCLRGLDRQITRWMDYVVADDLMVQLHDPALGAYGTLSFPEDAVAALRDDPRVSRLTGARTVFLPFRGDWLLLTCYDVQGTRPPRPLLGRDATDSPAWDAALRDGQVLVSGNFARLQGVRVGDDVPLVTPDGARPFRVAGIVEDYMWPRGTVFMDRAVYRRLWRDDTVNYVQVAVAPGASPEEVRADVEPELRERHQLFVFRAAEVVDYGTRLLHEWFRLADAQVLLPLVIGGIGVANTVLISLVTRTRQLGLLAAVGATPGRICRALAWEAAALGAASSLLGIALGLWILWGPVVGIVAAETGFDLERVVPWTALAEVLVGGVATGLLASLLPIAAARRLDLVAAIGYE